MPKIKILERKLSFNGIFNLNELYNLLIKIFKDKKYDVITPADIINQKEISKTNGVKIVIFEFKLDDYSKISLKTTILFTDVEKVNVENTITHEKMILNRGNVNIKFEGFIIYDYDKKFESYGIIGEIFRSVVQNKILKDYENKSKEILESHIEQANEILRRYLNIESIKNKIL